MNMVEKNKLVKICWRKIKEDAKYMREIVKHLNKAIKEKDILTATADALCLRIYLDFLSKKLYVLEVMEKEDYE